MIFYSFQLLFAAVLIDDHVCSIVNLGHWHIEPSSCLNQKIKIRYPICASYYTCKHPCHKLINFNNTYKMLVTAFWTLVMVNSQVWVSVKPWRDGQEEYIEELSNFYLDTALQKSSEHVVSEILIVNIQYEDDWYQRS